jgi:hypothetical protein
VIPTQLKTHFRTGEPVIQEFSALMGATFQYYQDTRALFFEKLPAHLHQSELISFVNVDLKNRLFNQAFCETIQAALKALRRVIIRLEDLHREHPNLTGVFSNLTRLIRLAERVDALYQAHWEHYRYQTRLSEQELVEFLLEIDSIAMEWERFQEGHGSIQGLVEALSGKPCPAEMRALVVTYQREGPDHFSVGTLRALMNFLEAGYRFVCATCEIDLARHPLTLLQVEMAEPVELHLAVPKQVEEPFRKLLQYLFLKDLLKGETLLKFVFEAIHKDYGEGKTLTAPAIASFQKELTAPLKQMPGDGTFNISGRTFPDQGIPVLQEFTRYLEEKKIKYDGLLKATEKRKEAAKPRPSPAPEKTPQSEQETTERALPPLPPPTASDKEHIRILTEPKT